MGNARPVKLEARRHFYIERHKICPHVPFLVSLWKMYFSKIRV